MLPEDEIIGIVKKTIEQDENPGYKSGSSDHVGYVSYVIDSVESRQLDECVELCYVYTIIIETEFTYYPDNPPHEYQYEKTIRVNDRGEVMSGSDKRCLKGPELDFDIPDLSDDE
ncbi:MAG: hypothetical protein ABIJ16_14255 [Bacteroidota bacterium]